jgi:hypothetical protein
MPAPARFRATLSYLLTALLLTIFLIPASPATSAIAEQSDPAQCSAQVAAADQLLQRIDAHNAEPHEFDLQQQQAQAAAYEAEAAQLRAEQATTEANLTACDQAISALTDTQPGSPPIKTPTQQKLNKIGNAQALLGSNWTPQPEPPEGNNWEVPETDPARPLFDELRKENPASQYIGSATLQGQPRPQVGDPDPAYDGRLIPPTKANPAKPAVEPDHIVPLAQIINLPGFVRLSPEHMYMVVNAPLNLQWMSAKANRSKMSRSVMGMRGVNPQWQQQQYKLQEQTRNHLVDIIQQLLKSQG